MQPLLFGILNCTPDSFSDGGQFDALPRAQRQLENLLENGADIIDIGGDASGPGSVCVGADEEWERVAGILETAGESTRLSIDTHNAEVARRALKNGVEIINDVSGGMDPEMFELVANSDVRYVCMFSCWTAPHVFASIDSEGIENKIVDFFSKKIDSLLASGVSREQIILDPGMGAFLSPDPEASLRVLANLPLFCQFELPVLIGLSRKRFLKALPGTESISSDRLSALVARIACERCTDASSISLRVHEPTVHREVFQEELSEVAIVSSMRAYFEERVCE